MTDSALTLDDYARRAAERLPAQVLDFIDGGAGQESTPAANRGAFDAVRLRPAVLTGAGSPSTATEILGRRWDAPVGVAPLAFHTLADPLGEVATARGVAAAGCLPFVVSTMAGRSLEEVAAEAAGRIPLWFQVYCLRDRGLTADLVHRAGAAGYQALVLTVDTPHLGRRLRDVRNGFRLPPGVVAANLTPGPLGTVGTVGTAGSAGAVDSPNAHALAEFDPDLDWSVVDWLRSVSPLPVILKGIMTAQDARRAIAAGADGIVVSNHGGRQLDGVPATLDVLPEIAQSVAGAVPVMLDGGVRRGRDVLAALARGADAVFLGRPVLHGLAAGGADGVRGVLDVVTGELRDALSLTGRPEVAAVREDLLWPQPQPQPQPPVQAAAADRPPGAQLRLADLHASLGDPVMDTMNFLNEVTLRFPEAISFAPGRPFDGFFDTEQIFTQIRRWLAHLGEQGRPSAAIKAAVFQYGPSAGIIRELIADSLRLDEDIRVPPEAVVVTVGAQEAMFLALRALISSPREIVMVSSPCYVGITGAARLLDIDVAAVAEGPEGFSAAAVDIAVRAEHAKGRRVRAFYVIPDHSNPSGVSIPLAERRALLEVASRHDFLVLEDSPYRLVSPGPRLLTLKKLDTDRRVVQLGSYSKTVFPGARLGYAVADQVVIDAEGRRTLLADALAKVKSMVTVNTSALSQAVVAGALLAAGGRAAELNLDNAERYDASLRATLAQLERRFPAAVRAELGVSWNQPAGGFFISLQVPFVAGNEALDRSAADHGVLWTPMSYFYPGGGGERGIRLSISYLTPEEIETGIARLAGFVAAEAGVQLRDPLPAWSPATARG